MGISPCIYKSSVKAWSKQLTIRSAFGLKSDDCQRDPLSIARGRVHVYSSNDIERASNKRKKYITFWNLKAQEFCSDQSFSSYKKQELHGVIDTAWRMHSCSLLVDELEQLYERHDNKKTKTLSRNIKRLKSAEKSAKEINATLAKIRIEVHKTNSKNA